MILMGIPQHDRDAGQLLDQPNKPCEILMERQTGQKAQKTPDRVSQHHAQSARSSSGAHPFLELQRSIGNQAVQRLINSPYIQTKLQVSTPGDPYEQEADRVADTVMRMTAPQATQEEATNSIERKPLATRITRLVQREPEQPTEEEKEETIATKPVVQRAPLAVREDDEEEKVAKKLDSGLLRQSEKEEKTVATKLATDAPLQRQARDGDEREEETLQTSPIQRQTEEEEEEKVQTKSLSSQLSPSLRIHSVHRSASAVIQRLCTECEEEKQQDQRQSGVMVHRKSAPERLPDDDDVEKQQVQPKGAQNAAPRVTTSVAANIHAMNGGGSPLSNTTRAFFEPRFGADFSHVRVHTDSRATQTASSINAKAFTVGNNIAFGTGQYTPESREGMQVLAHELTHVVQQNGSQAQRTPQLTIQRQPCPGTRDSDEMTKSQSPVGVLAADTSFDAAKESLSVQDFGIGQDSVRSTMTDSDDWRRMMSMILGDPTAQVAVLGYSDCVGPEQNNRGLRERRASAVINAMPAEAQAKVSPILKGWWGNLTYRFPNNTAENRARNRMVLVALLRAPTDSCDRLPKATNMDQYIFLVSCLEKRLGLTNAADAPKTLSLLRQLYFGNASWSTQRNRSKVWDDIITDRPWSPGDDPTPKLGAKLLTALQDSKEVKFDSSATSASIEVSHLLTGLDALRNPQQPSIHAVGPIHVVPDAFNHELATWAGDVASAATNYTLCVDYGKFSASYDDFFKDMAPDADLEGDIDTYAAWAALNYSAPPNTIALQLHLPVSEVLMQYYRLKDTLLGKARAQRFEVFANFYGAKVQGRKMQDRLAFQQNIARPVSQIAFLTFFKQLREILQGNTGSLGNCAGGKPPVQTGQPSAPVDLMTLIGNVLTASVEMTERFTIWLEQRL